MRRKHAVLGAVLALAAAASLAQGERREVKWNNPDGPAVPGVEHHSFKSPSMGLEVGYNVYLPPGYGEGKNRYPVIYFLHGAGGNENSDAGGFSGLAARMAAQKKIAPAICVFPNGGMSGYQDRPDEKVFGETLIVKELVPLIDRSYRTQAAPAGRVLAGFSMGGGGAVRLALKYPELFSAAASWAGAITPRRGDPPAELKADALAKAVRKVRLLMIVGDQDQTFQGNEAFHKTLEEAKYSHTYQVLPGVPHNLGMYYEKTGEDLVAFLGEGLAVTTASDPARDQAVLEALMLNLLRTPRVVERNRTNDQRVWLAEKPIERSPSLEEFAEPISKSEGKIASHQLPKVTEAILDATRRLRDRDSVQPFTPVNEHVLIDGAGHRQELLEPDLTQVFFATSPGYSRDGNTAMVSLSFAWSRGFHRASAAFVLTKVRDQWKVTVSRFRYYV
jgi:endo-1,4-beta-xylanase